MKPLWMDRQHAHTPAYTGLRCAAFQAGWNTPTYLFTCTAPARLTHSTPLHCTATHHTLTGLVLRNLGQDRQPRAFSDILGALFFHTMAMGLFPYASQSLFLYDRQFYQGENGARLYPPSCYYCANLTLELLLNAGNGFTYGLISYYMLNYQAFVQAPDPALSAVGFIGLITLTNVVANVRTCVGRGGRRGGKAVTSDDDDGHPPPNTTQTEPTPPKPLPIIQNSPSAHTPQPPTKPLTQAQVLFFSLASPNFEVAFISSSGLTALSALLAGCVVSYPAVSLAALQYVSSTKYAYTAILLLFFKGNPKTVTPFGTVDEVMDVMKLTNPGTVWANVLAMLGIYSLFSLGGFFCLKYLYKEQR